VPGVNRLGSHGRWKFTEFTDVWQIQADFEARMAQEFDRWINQSIEQTVAVEQGGR
jgi:type III restriction enzyme